MQDEHVTGIEEQRHQPLRGAHHHVQLERFGRQVTQGADLVGSEQEVGNVVTVHDVEVERVAVRLDGQ